MTLEAKKEKISINKLICEKTEKISIEGDAIVPDAKPDILNTIDTSGNICIYKKELTDDKIKLDGSVNVYVMYLAENSEDTVRGLNVNLDFSKSITAPNCTSDMILDANVTIENINASVINGRKINTKVEAQVKFRVYSKEDVELVSGIEDGSDVQILEESLNVNSLVGVGTTKSYVKETMQIDQTHNLAEILRADINMVDKDVKISYNKVLAKAEAEVKIMYLTEENNIFAITNRIPVVGFIDMPNVSEENICDTNYEIKNMIISSNAIEEHSVHIELEIEASCMAYENRQINLIQDLYSPVNSINYNQNIIETTAGKSIRKETCKIREIVNVKELESGNLLNTYTHTSIIKVNKLTSKVMYEGELKLNYIILESSTNVISKVVKLPFEFTVDDIENAEKLNIDTSTEIANQEFIVGSGGEVNCNIDIGFNLNMSKNIKLNIIDNVEIQENRDVEDYSLVIYVVKQGDTLWKIAKLLNSTIDDIVKANAIENADLIHTGDKLYVPKYRNKKYA